MNWIQIILNIVIIIWLFTIERRIKLIDKAFGTIGIVIDRLYQGVFGKDKSE